MADEYQLVDEYSQAYRTSIDEDYAGQFIEVDKSVQGIADDDGY